MNATAAATTTTAMTPYTTRLPRPTGYEARFWKILCEIIFPNVSNPASVMLAVEYCRERKLDILKRPVNIVPMWNAQLRREVDTVWPSIHETTITAHRSNEFAGVDPPVLGNIVQHKFSGRRKDRDGGWIDATVELRIPESASVTVYRFKNGERCPYTEPVYWLEAYGRSGGSELPNAIWQKRPIGQLTKVAKAASLRLAFPEESQGLTDEEMHGQIIDEAEAPMAEAKERTTISEVVQPEIPSKPMKVDKPGGSTWTEWGRVYIACIRSATDAKTLEQWEKLNKETMDAISRDEPKVHSGLLHSINKHKLSVMNPEENTPLPRDGTI
jgi:phage recombination protein Bet